MLSTEPTRNNDDIVVRALNLADACDRAGDRSLTAAAFGAMLNSVIHDGTNITDITVDPASLSTAMALRLAATPQPWQEPALDPASAAAAGDDYARRWDRPLKFDVGHPGAESPVELAVAPATPAQRPDTQSRAVLDDAVLDVIRRAGGTIGLPGIAASLRQDPYPTEGGPVSVAAVLSSLDRLMALRKVTVDTTDTTTLYRIAE